MRKQHKYRHLDQTKRDRIQALWDHGHEQQEIANIIEVHKSTISREIQRNRRRKRAAGGVRKGPYEASVANHKAYLRRRYAKYQGKKINEHDTTRMYIISCLKRYYSPDEISGRMRREHQPFYASKTAIYEWLYTSRGSYWCRYLYSRHYRPKKRKGNRAKKVLIPHRIGIQERPLGATNKTRYGHYESDTVVSAKKTGSRAALAVLYERKAKYIEARKISGLRPSSTITALQEMKEGIAVKSITFDNGIENTKHTELGVPTYFCDPYSSWQKGGVENANKMIRRFILKKSDLGDYSDEYVKMVIDILNSKPRKSLGYKTPYEVMVKHNLFVTNKKAEVALRG